MDLTTSIYDLASIPKSVYDQLNRDFKLINKFLRLDAYMVSEPMSVEDYLADLDDYPLSSETLPSALITEVENFIRQVLEMEPSSTNYILNEKQIAYLVRVRNLLGEQDTYIEGLEDCSSWYLVSKTDDLVYGGLFAFWNENQPEDLLIQGIGKYLAPAVIAAFLPEYDQYLPRLNSLLQAGVESLARRLKVKRIYAAPIGKQGSILERHYGYRKSSTIYYPCTGIFGRDNVLMNLEAGLAGVYVKEMSD